MGKNYPVTGTPGREHTQFSGFSPCEGSSWRKQKGSPHGSPNLLWFFTPLPAESSKVA